MAIVQVPKVGVITRKGQITIPAEIRNALDLKEGDRVEFRLEGGEITIRRAINYGERTAGIFAKYRLERTLTIQETIEEEDAAFEQALIEDAERTDFE